MRRALLHSVGRVVAHPVFCWLVSTAAVIGRHVPILFEMGLQSELWHGVEHASFFVAGLLFWWPVVQPWPSLARWPRWSVALYLFLASPPCEMLSAFLVFCDRVVYPHYLSSHEAFSVSPLGDQERAGALMWICVTCLPSPGGSRYNPDTLAASRSDEDEVRRIWWPMARIIPFEAALLSPDREPP